MLSQGDQGEHAAVAWLMSKGYPIFLPIGNPPNYDVVAEIDGRLVGVQVKTTRVWQKDRWVVTLATRGGNQSWNGLVKRFSADRCDYLYAHTACGRRWFIPAADVEGGAGLCLGGPKYAQYEVDPGLPLTLSSAARRGTEAVKRGGL
jgi:Holliday junction resolvase-like predicted endonuclease